ncbi:MAG: hypothetical protein JNM89_01320 [Hyphomicrobiaceae bacterium]|nr:hypothetical protein [Hyphomicrobiaceae bacterium]
MTLSAIIDASNQTPIALSFEVYGTGGLVATAVTDTFTTGTGKVLIPIGELPAGDYHWKVKTAGADSAIEFSPNETNFSIFNGFEPYPYGYRFNNAGLTGSILNGGTTSSFNATFPYYHRNYTD